VFQSANHRAYVGGFTVIDDPDVLHQCRKSRGGLRVNRNDDAWANPFHQIREIIGMRVSTRVNEHWLDTLFVTDKSAPDTARSALRGHTAPPAALLSSRHDHHLT
jgi:hypothetical protein